MERVSFKHVEDAGCKKELVEGFIRENNGDFNPPFSERGNIGEKADSYTEGKELVEASKNGETIAILLFTRGGERGPIEKYCPCLYVNLIIVDKGYRNKGVGSSLYNYLKKKILPKSNYNMIGGRTWSENEASQSCFKKSGFRKVAEGESSYNEVYYYIFKSQTSI